MDTDNDQRSAVAVQPVLKDEYQTWKELHALTQHWQSDLNFFHEELNFLNILFDRYFSKLTSDENLIGLRHVTTTLSGIEMNERALNRKIAQHLKHLEELLINPFSHDAQLTRDEHATLENELASFVNSFRTIKAEVFNLAQQLLRSEKAKHLLGP